VAQADGYPLRGLFAPQQWQPGDLVRDVRTILLPDGLPEGNYTITLGWYDKNSGARLPALDRQGQPVADDAVPIFP
jgi:hypothetical protein